MRQKKSYLVFVYFVSWVMFGVWCLLNMFLAIVLQNFEKDQKRALENRLEEQRLANHSSTSPKKNKFLSNNRMLSALVTFF
jgi:hypothetical protein